MGNIFSNAAPLLDTGFTIAIYTLCYLLFIAVILAIGISLCMYIDHRRQVRLSRAALVVEGTLDDEGNECEDKDEEAALLPSQTQSHQDQLFTVLQSCTDVNEKLPLLSNKYGATTPLRVLDKRFEPEHTINKPTTFPQRSTTNATVHIAEYFTKYGMTEAVCRDEMERRDEESHTVIQHL
ncbi:MAG: hypothetical protein Q9175_007363 [Cornicularia normoerica]